MQNQIKTKTRLAFIQFIFSTFFSDHKIIDETENFQKYFYKLSVPSIEKDKDSIWESKWATKVDLPDPWNGKWKSYSKKYCPTYCKVWEDVTTNYKKWKII